MNKKQKLYNALAILFVILCWLVAGNMGMEDQQLENQHYCNQVQDWIDSDGKYGWPDYDNKFEDICK